MGLFGAITGSNKVEQKNKLLSSVKNVKHNIDIDKYTTLVEKEDSSFVIVGIDKITALNEPLGKLEYSIKADSKFILLFDNKIGIIKLNILRTSSTDISYVDFQEIDKMYIETLTSTKKTTKKTTNGLGGIGFIGVGNDRKVTKTTTRSEEYEGTALGIKLKKKEGKWLAKTIGIVFQEPTDAIKLQSKIEEEIQNFNSKKSTDNNLNTNTEIHVDDSTQSKNLTNNIQDTTNTTASIQADTLTPPSDEKILCSADGIFLTENRFIVNNDSYLISDIKSVEIKKSANLLSYVSAGLLLTGFYFGSFSTQIGIGLIVVAVLIFLVNKKPLNIILNLKSSGKKSVLKDTNKEAILGFVDGINKAIKKSKEIKYPPEKQSLIDEMTKKGYSFNDKFDTFTANNSPASCKLLYENGIYTVSEPA